MIWRNAIVSRIEARNAAPLAGFYDRYATISGPDLQWAKTARRRSYLPWGVWDDDSIDDPDAAPDLSALRVDEPRRRIDLDEVVERLSYGQDLADVAAALGFAEASVKEALKQRQRRERQEGAA